ncbi:MAG: Fic family protein [Gemmatimonadetes bacterium]|nr:Fic family protein [Gemmatimonadota bacterium]
MIESLPMNAFEPLETLSPDSLETPNVLRKVAGAARQLAELKGVTGTIPNRGILINTLGLQEAKDSSEIENIVTTHDELFKDARLPEHEQGPAAKEVHRYVRALRTGFAAVSQHGLLTNNHIMAVQAELEPNRAGFRQLTGTSLKNQDGLVIYTPPDPPAIVPLMTDLERFINEPERLRVDPLIKMALIHHRFETIHPFYDGNGRTGRIMNVLYLVMQGLIDIPVLYMSRHIIGTKSEYYRLLQSVRVDGQWEPWLLYMLSAVETTARDGIRRVERIRDAMLVAKHRIRSEFRSIYSQELINNLFALPYTRVQFVQQDLDVSRATATRYLDVLARAGILVKRRAGRSNVYINPVLYEVLTGASLSQT